MKVWFRRLHLVLALLSGLFLVSLSISGGLLLYAKDIQAWINPQYWLVEDKPNPLKKAYLPLSELVERIENKTQQKVLIIEEASQINHSWQARLVNKKYLNINPYTGEILLEHRFYDTFYGFVMSWHRWLLYTDEQGKTPMKVWMSIASLILIIEIVFGVYLWLKPKHRLKRLKVRWRAKNRVLLHQLHGTLGVLFALPLILIAFTGMTFQWQAQTKAIVQWLTLGQVEQLTFKGKVSDSKNNYQLDKAYMNAKSALADGSVYRIYLPKTDQQPLALRMKMPQESHGYSWSWANPYSGEVLSTFNAGKASWTTQVWNFRYKFHIGEFIGWPVKVLWLLISASPVFFVFTGIYLWLKRVKVRQHQQVRENLKRAKR